MNFKEIELHGVFDFNDVYTYREKKHLILEDKSLDFSQLIKLEILIHSSNGSESFFEYETINNHRIDVMINNKYNGDYAVSYYLHFDTHVVYDKVVIKI